MFIPCSRPLVLESMKRLILIELFLQHQSAVETGDDYPQNKYQLRQEFLKKADYTTKIHKIYYLISTTWTKSDDSDISSSVALNAATCMKQSLIQITCRSKHTLWAASCLTKVVGSFWMKPTVSVRRNSLPFLICSEYIRQTHIKLMPVTEKTESLPNI